MVVRRIEEAVRNVVLVLDTFKPIKIALDDAEAFAKAVELAHKVHAKLAEEQLLDSSPDTDAAIKLNGLRTTSGAWDGKRHQERFRAFRYSSFSARMIFKPTANLWRPMALQ